MREYLQHINFRLRCEFSREYLQPHVNFRANFYNVNSCAKIHIDHVDKYMLSSLILVNFEFTSKLMNLRYLKNDRRKMRFVPMS